MIECKPDVDFLLLRQLLRLTLRTHVESDDDGVRSRSQQHVGLGDGAHTRAQNLQPHLVVRQLGQQVGQHFHRAADVRLQDDVQFLRAGGLQLLGQTFQRHAGTLGQRGFAGFLFAVFGNAARLVAIRDDYKLIAGLRQSFHTQNFDRSRRRRGFELVAAIVKHGAHFAVHVADDEVVAVAQSSVLHQQRRHGSAAAIQLGFENHAGCRTIRRRL